MNNNNNARKPNIEEIILDELKINCRANLDNIAKKCDCSRYKVGRIMKKLEENKTIIGYGAIINPNKTNKKHYILLIKRTIIPMDDTLSREIPKGDISDLLPDLDVKYINTLYVNGNFDWLISFRASNISKAKELSNRMLEIYGRFIDSIELLEMVIPFRLEGVRIHQPKDVSKIL
jgi:DNA-binding Lrp family transcriptional regulator